MLDLVVYGTRPEEIKVWPLTKYERFSFLQVNQSKDLHQNLIEKPWKCEEDKLADAIETLGPDRIIVQGDTRTAFRAALWGFENQVEVAHIEAGMRTWDLAAPFPEEGYRRMIDQISTWKFCSTEEAAVNCDGMYVGQTSIDTLAAFAPPVSDQGYWIVTAHRRESWDLADGIIEKLEEEAESGKELRVFAHPNLLGRRLRQWFNCEEPQNYRDFVRTLAGCTGVITDSGGLVEEAVYLGKQIVHLREKRERGHGETYSTGATQRIYEALND